MLPRQSQIYSLLLKLKPFYTWAVSHEDVYKNTSAWHSVIKIMHSDVNSFVVEEQVLWSNEPEKMLLTSVTWLLSVNKTSVTA